MKFPILIFSLLPLLGGCSPQGEQVTLGAPLTKALKTTELANDANQRLAILASQTNLSDNALFAGYRGAAASRWNSNWTRSIDFSGVSWNHRQAGTAITPRHVVFAAHYALGAGTNLTFHDRTGTVHNRKVAKLISLRKRKDGSQSDITVALLDSPLPPSVKTYRLLPPRTDYGYTLPGCPALVTEQGRRVFIHEVARVSDRFISFKKNASYPEALYKSLIKGDSGNPSFLLVGGEPVLVETHTGGGPGSGPFYSSPKIFKALQEVVAELDPSYQIKTIPLDSQLAPAPAKKKAAVKASTPTQGKPSSPATGKQDDKPKPPRVRRVPIPSELKNANG